VHQVVVGHDTVGVHQQRRQQGTLPTGADRDRPPVDGDLERSSTRNWKVMA